MSLPVHLTEDEVVQVEAFRETGLSVGGASEIIICAQANAILKHAFESLQKSLAATDYARYESIRLDQVVTAAKQLDDALGEQAALPNLGRLRVLFKKLAFYQEAMRVPSSKYPYLSWLWAPILLTLRVLTTYHGQVLVKHSEVLKLLLAAYKSIGEAMPPHIDQQLVSWTERQEDIDERQQLLAIVYDDILEIHRHVYELFARRGWEIFFSVWWKSIDARLAHIVHDLALYCDQLRGRVDAEIIKDTKQRRETWREELKRQDEEQAATQLTNVKMWLDAAKLDQEDELETLVERSHEDNCTWVQENPKLKSWLLPSHDHNVLWLKGKPGSGKSVLCANIIKTYLRSDDVIMLYFFSANGRDAKMMLRSFILQLIQKKPELCAFIQENFMIGQSSLAQTRRLVPLLIAAFTSVRVVVDGVDDCDGVTAAAIIKSTLALASITNTKALISSQDVDVISKALSGRSSIDLSQERIPMQAAIMSLIRARIEYIPALSCVDSAYRKRVENKLASQADGTMSASLNEIGLNVTGMFLWVELITWRLGQADSVQDVEGILSSLPDGLNKAYQKLFHRLASQSVASSNDNVLRILQCLACGQRAMKQFEVQDAITFAPGVTNLSSQNRVQEIVFERCKPLIERTKDGIIRLVHGSVKAYLIQEKPLSFDLETAHANLGFSCLAYLGTSVTLISEAYGDKTRFIEVAQGLHGFCRYACAYWTEHLLSYLALVSANSNLSDEQRTRRDQILTAAENVAASLMSLSRDYFNRYQMPDRDLDPRCAFLNKQRPLFKFVTSALELQLQHKIAPRKGQLPSGPSNPHPTSRIVHKYDEISKKLLQEKQVVGVDADLHQRFRQTYGTSVFTCRMGRCPRMIHGFETATDRDKHEKGHVQDYRCSYPQCFGHQGGIGNVKNLNEHMRQYHPQKSKSPEPAQMLQTIRSDTDATLVEHNLGTKQDSDFSPESESEDEDIPYGDRFVKLLINSYSFARATIR